MQCFQSVAVLILSFLFQGCAYAKTLTIDKVENLNLGSDSNQIEQSFGT